MSVTFNKGLNTEGRYAVNIIKKLVYLFFLCYSIAKERDGCFGTK